MLVSLCRIFILDQLEGFSKIANLEDDEYYYSKEGYIIFTEKYLLKRGHCCQNNCKHCPYGYNEKKIKNK